MGDVLGVVFLILLCVFVMWRTIRDYEKELGLRKAMDEELLMRKELPNKDGYYWVGLAKKTRIFPHVKFTVPCIFKGGKFRMLVPGGMYIKDWTRQPEEMQEKSTQKD